MLSDLRLTWRTLAKSPGFVVIAVLTLTLGIGVNAAVFSIVNAVLLRGLPFPQADRLLAINTGRPRDGEPHSSLSQAEFADLRAQQKSFTEVVAYTDGTLTISGPGADPERVTGCTLRGAGVPVLGVPIALGRWFTAADDAPAAPPTVVLGHALWANRYRSSADILGQQLKINGEWATIIGVAPQWFRFPNDSELWRPWRYAKNEGRDNRYLQVFGRLKPDVSTAQARAELATIGGQWAADFVATNRDRELLARPLHDAFVDEGTRKLIWIMFGAVGLVLLIACANVANLLLARAAGRQKEISVRAALGSTRGRILRLLLTESLVLSVLGAALALPLAWGLMALLNRDLASARTPPYWMVFDLDAKGMAYIGALALMTTLAAGLWPAWRTSYTDVNVVLKDGGRGATGFALSRFTRALVIGEVALSCVLLVLAGLTIRTVVKAQTAPVGFETAGVLACRVALPETSYPDPVRQRQFWREVLERLAARPEIAAVGYAELKPTWESRVQVEFEGRPRGGEQGSGLPPQYASRCAVSGSYFATLGIKLTQGRIFDDRDAPTAMKVAIVSTRFAERHWPRENPLGQRFVYGWGLNVKPEDWITVVGVVAPTMQGEFNYDGEERPQTYVPYAQVGGLRYGSLFAKARGSEAAALTPVLRAVVRSLDDDLPIYYVETLAHMVTDARYFKGLFAWIFGLFGGVALVLAGVGLYGVMSYSVSQRTQEIGVRMALGAEPRDVLALLLREGGNRLAIGLALGLPAAYFAGRLQAFVLWGVTPGDPTTFLATLVALGAAGLLACLLPALRAVRVSPVEALRYE